MKNLKKTHLLLIAAAVLILLGCIGVTAYLLFSNYQNVRLFKLAQSNFERGDPESLDAAEAQLLELIRNDDDNEEAYVMLGEIAARRQVYPEQVYYCYMACRLNPLSAENKDKYIRSLLFARYFERLENFLAQQSNISDEYKLYLAYAAGRNGNVSKYQLPQKSDDPLYQLVELLFKDQQSDPERKLEILAGISSDDPFVKQEILAAKAELYLSLHDFDNVENVLKEAYELNSFAFAPVLGRFYANFRTFGQALTVLESHLAVYRDPLIAMQTAEIYCLLGKTDKIAGLRSGYQSDSGDTGMLCIYYFDALTALAENDMTALKELSVPLRGKIDTPLSAYMFFCVDMQKDDLSAINAAYTKVLAHRNYLDLQDRADGMIRQLLADSLSGNNNNEELLFTLAKTLYDRKPDAFTAKYLLLIMRRRNSVNLVLLQDALRRFGNDPGIIKFAIEYYLANDLSAAGNLIASYREQFPEKVSDMLRYEIIHAAKSRDFDWVSELFRSNFSAELLPEYWHFASSTMRVEDLQFLSRDQVYGPFCRALLLLKEGNKAAACDILADADAGNDPALLFFAAKTLGENGREQAALDKYSRFTPESPYYTVALLNMAEIFAGSGNNVRALELARAAYLRQPDSPEVQFCYADKLYKNGKFSEIPDVLRLSDSSPYLQEVKTLWIAGMQAKIKQCDIRSQREVLRELCRRLLVVAPDDRVALEYLEQLDKTPH